MDECSTRSQPAQPTEVPAPLSDWSSPIVPNSAWCSQNFMLGAGMVIIQPSARKVVLIFDRTYKRWFLPRGRKDIGESLEATALREAYEESGYRAEFLPLYTFTHAPPPPSDPEARSYLRLNTEPIFTSITSWNPERRRRHFGGEYITFWYVGQIPQNAVHTTGTGMPDEQDYESYLLTYERARASLYEPERAVLDYAWSLFRQKLELEERLAEEGRQPEASDRGQAISQT